MQKHVAIICIGTVTQPKISLAYNKPLYILVYCSKHKEISQEIFGRSRNILAPICRMNCKNLNVVCICMHFCKRQRGRRQRLLPLTNAKRYNIINPPGKRLRAAKAKRKNFCLPQGDLLWQYPHLTFRLNLAILPPPF